MENSLHNKVAIVTGAGQGVGAAIAQALAAVGVRVAVNDLNPDRAERTAVAIREAGGQAIAVAADVANKFQCVHIIETTRAEWGQLDILVNNAAIMPQSTLLKLDEWEWNRCLEVNLKGTFFMSQLCGRVMADENHERGGVIVNIASTAGVDTPLENRAAYCASKAGVVGFSRECAREYAQYNLRVHVLLPDEERPSTPHQIAETIVTLCQNPTQELIPPLPVT
ncbi:MAG: SDR family oxidoreductase [Ardenticatenaceae bacterium]|nr:SDR family oxidoreductase [Anaerolineales bacterium]MCB8976895.1 SDR family oxidoreductase [Ardenticatenaceae bacterium]